MIKVIIVDDEYLVRMGLKTTINWNEMGFEIVGDADNGEKALELARKLRPDLVLTDIRMPKMDGLELIRALKEELPETKVVVLSCYQDFEYVREAMQFLGALDYVPKLSMQSGDIADIMANVKRVIEKDNEEQGRLKELELQTNQDNHAMRNNWLRDLLMGTELDEDSWVIRGKSLKLNLNLEKGYTVISLYIHSHDKLFRNNSSIRSSIINLLDDIIEKNKWHGDTFHIEDEEYCIILNFHGYPNRYYFERLESLCEQAINNLRLYLNISASFGVGPISSEIFKIGKSYSQASKACQFSFYKGIETMSYSEEILPYHRIWYFDKKMAKALTSYLEEGQEEAVTKLMGNYFEKVTKDRRVDPSIVMNECRDILSIFTSVLKVYGTNIHDLDKEDPYETLSSCETLEDLRKWFSGFIEKYFQHLKNVKDNIYGKDIMKAVEYIMQNYDQEIKLVHIASHIGMNESYLSHLFKKETGYGFTDFINNVRIKRAKDLLRLGDMNINEVSSCIGYTNPSYFSKVFKQIVGRSPIEYKKESKNI